MPSTTWYDRATVYALDVKRFADSDGDGIGDFRGLTDRLDYLSDLGISALWLLPFYPSPWRDNGYDVADYCDVDERLGGLDEFEAFVDAAHDRDMRVITDLVVNHTSDQHPWFQQARADPDSEYRDFYVWCDDPPQHATDGGAAMPPGANEESETTVTAGTGADASAATGARDGAGAGAAAETAGSSMFPGEVEDARVWSYDEEADAHYYHRFYPFQPELNVANPAVREAIGEIIGFWLDRGVDGFRLDAATLMIQPKGVETATEDPFDLLGELKRYATDRRTDAVMVAEADDAPANLESYVDGGGMDSLLNFALGAAIFEALATESAGPLTDAFATLPELSAGRWGNFLRNHDELNLATLPPSRREAVYDAFAPNSEMRIFERGIRRRLAPMLDGDRDRIELAHALLFSMPGTPVLYYGDELGMGEDLSLPGRDAVRTPMQWSDEANAGFSSAPASSLISPPVSEGPFAASQVNVAAQEDDPDSLLAWMRNLVTTRAAHSAFAEAQGRVVETDTDAFVVRYDHSNGAMVCLLNLTPGSVTVDLETSRAASEVVLGDSTVESGDAGLRVGLAGYGYAWLTLGDGENGA